MTTFLERATAVVKEYGRSDGIGDKLIDLVWNDASVGARIYGTLLFPFQQEADFNPENRLCVKRGTDGQVKAVLFHYIDRGIKNWAEFGRFLSRFPAVELVFVGQNYSELGIEDFLEKSNVELIVLEDQQSEHFNGTRDIESLADIAGPFARKKIDCTLVVFAGAGYSVSLPYIKEDIDRVCIKYTFDRSGFAKTVKFIPGCSSALDYQSEHSRALHDGKLVIDEVEIKEQ